MIRLFLVFTIAAATCSNSDGQENWGHWRGPTGNGTSADAKPPTEWSASKNVKWKVEIPGRGSGSPIVFGDKVFVVTAVSEKGAGGAQPPAAAPQRGGRGRRGGRRQSAPLTKTSFKIICFDRNTGDKAWEKTAVESVPHEGAHSTNNFAPASPCTDGEHVYAHFGSRGLYCYTLDGEMKWKREFGKMQTRAGFGEGSSPTIADDKIIVPWDHEGQSMLYALNKKDGEVIWETKRDEPTNWSTPLIVEHKGKKQIVLNGQTCARAYDLESGSELWRCDGQTERPCASAVAMDDMVFVGSGHRGSFMAGFKLGGSGDIENSENVAWTLNRDITDIASPLLSNGRIYMHKGKTGMVSCVDAKTGKTLFPASRLPGLSSIYASPIAAGGNVYLTGRSGTTVVIKDSEKLEIVATNSVGETVDATPAPFGDQLFIRGEKHLFCISK